MTAELLTGAVRVMKDGASLWGAVGVGALMRSMIILAIAGVSTILLRRHSAALRHLIWSSAIAAALLIPALTLALPSWQVAIAVPSALSRSESAVPLRKEFVGTQATPEGWELPAGSEASVAAELPVLRPRGEEALAVGDAADAAGTPREKILDPATIETTASQTPDLALLGGNRSLAEPVPLKADPILLVGLLWSAGTLFLLVRLALAVGGVQRIVRRTLPLTSGPAAEKAGRLAREMGIHRPVRILAGGPADLPMTWGVLRPTILLPSDHHTWPEERLSRVLTHELAHVRRRDYAIQLIGEVAIALYWLNPLVWIAGRRLRVEREMACDDAVIRSGALSSAYAEDLVEIVRSMRSRKPVLVGVGMARATELHLRLNSLFDERRSRTGAATPLGGLLAGAVFVLAVGIAMAAPTGATAGEADGVGRGGTEVPGRGENQIRGLDSTGLGVFDQTAVLGENLSAEVSGEGDGPEGAILPANLDLDLDMVGTFARSDLRPRVEEVLPAIPSSRRPAFQDPAGPASLVTTGSLQPPTARQEIQDLIPALHPCWALVRGTASIYNEATPSLIHIGREQRFITLKVFRRIRCRVEVKVEGQVEFTPDFRGIAWLAPGSSVAIDEVEGKKRWSLRIAPGLDGAPIIAWRVDGDAHDFDNAAEAWLATHLAALFRVTGLQGHERAEWILREWGQDGLIHEIDVGALTAMPDYAYEWFRAPRTSRTASIMLNGYPFSPYWNVLSEHLARRVVNEGPDDSDVVDFLRGFPSMPLIRAVASRYAVEGEIAAALFGALKPMGFYREDVAGFLIDLAENRPLDGEFGNLFFESLASVRTISSGDTMAPVSEAVFSSLVRRDVLSALEVDVILEGIRTLLLVGPGAEIVTGWSGAVGTTTQRTAILSPLIRSFLVEIAERHGHHLIGERADQYREVAGMLYPLSESNRALQALRTSTPLGAVQ